MLYAKKRLRTTNDARIILSIIQGLMDDSLYARRTSK